MVEVLRKLATVIRANRKRLAIAIAGQSLYQVLDKGIDFVLLPTLMLWWGTVYGALAYMTFTLLYDLGQIKGYNKIGKDILGLEMAKEMRGFIGKKLLKSKKISELSLGAKTLLILTLCLRLNPFEIMIFMRQANEYREKMNTEDWFIFWVSYFGGNLYWVIVMGGFVEVVKFLFPFTPFIF